MPSMAFRVVVMGPTITVVSFHYLPDTPNKDPLINKESKARRG